MIELISSSTRLNIDALGRVNPDYKFESIESLFDGMIARLHKYYTFIIKTDLETYRLLRDYHIGHVNYNLEVCIVSGSLHELTWLVFQLMLAEDLTLRLIAKTLLDKFTNVFGEIPRAKDGTLIPWRSKQ